MSTSPVIQMTIGDETLVFEGPQVRTAHLVVESSPISDELPGSSIEFTIISTDETFSMFNADRVNLLAERLPILAYERVDGSLKWLGKFYLEDWSNLSEQEIQFQAIDLIGVMEEMAFEGIFWASPVTLDTALRQVLVPADIPYDLDPSIASRTLKGWIAPGSYRSALKQMLFAARATVSTFGSDKLTIRSVALPNKMPDVILADASVADSRKPSLLPLVYSVELVSHDYKESDAPETVFDGILGAGTHKIIFERPYYNIEIIGPGFVPDTLVSTEGDRIVTTSGDWIAVGGSFQFGPNSVTLTLSEEAEILITGYPWQDRMKSFQFVEADAASYGNKKMLSIREATLVSEDAAQGVLDTLRDYYRQRYQQEYEVLPSDVTPGAKVLVNTYYRKKLLTQVRRIEFDMAGGFLGRVLARGIVPQYVPPMEHPYLRPRTGVAVAGANLLRQNMFREYA
ncbi:MAG: hypothetical protein KF821_01850 [Anaerolineales bacterium]|nr:hypothetical protein [Anaerolineales bacterium]